MSSRDDEVPPDGAGSGQAADVVREVPLPPRALESTSLPRVDYWDAFCLDSESARDVSCEIWARAMLEGAPGRVRKQLLGGWTMLGLRLDLRGSGQDTVLGWKIRINQPELLILGAGSLIGMPAELAFVREPKGLVFSTLVQQKNPLARMAWSAVERPHLSLVPRLLGHAPGQLAGVSPPLTEK